MPTSDIFTGLNDTDILAMQQDTQARLTDVFSNNPKQFADPNGITQPQAPKGLYGTINSGENINIDRNSPQYVGAQYDSLMNKTKQQYPDTFKQLPDVLLPQSETRRYTGNKFGFDVTRDNEDFYNSQQNAGWEFLGKSIFGRLPLLTISKLGTGVGYLLGLANPANWFEKNYISAASDNSFAKFFEGMEDKVKNDWLPIYQKAAARDMGFFERAVKDQTFWSGDIIDAAAFMASATIPGIGVSKLGLGAKLAASLGMTEDAAIGASAEYLQQAALKSAKFARGVDVGLTTALNTASESMFEAKQVRDDVYNQLMATGKYTDQEAKNIAGDKARNSFLSNLAALSASNLWESNLIFKALGKSTVEQTAKLAGTSLLEDYTGSKAASKLGKLFEGKLGFYGKKALEGIGVEGFYEENIQQAIQQYNEDSKNTDNKENPFSYAGHVLGRMWNQTVDALQGKDKDTAMNIGVGALIGGLFGTSMEVMSKEYSQHHAATKSALDALNYARNNWLKIQDIYSIDDKGNLVTDYGKAAGVLLTQSANTDKMQDTQKMSDPVAREIAQKQLFASLVSSHLDNGSFNKLIDQLDQMRTWKPQDLVKLGFDTDTEGANLKIEEYKRFAESIKDIKETIDRVRPIAGVDPGVNQFRKNRLFDLAVTRQAAVQELGKVGNKIAELETKIGAIGVTDGFVNEVNGLKLRIASQQMASESADESSKPKIESKLKRYEKELEKLLNDNEETTKDLKSDKDGYFLYRNESKNNHPLVNELHNQTIKKATLENSIEDLSDEYDNHLTDKQYSKNKYDKELEKFQEYVEKAKDQQKDLNLNTQNVPEAEQVQQPTGDNKTPEGKTETPEAAQQTTPVQTEAQAQDQVSTPSKAQDLLDKRNADIAAATSQEEKDSINKKYIQDLLALGANKTDKVLENAVSEKNFKDIKDSFPKTKTINRDEHLKISNAISNSASQGDITSEQEQRLLDELNIKKIVGTSFNTEADFEDETPDESTEDTSKAEPKPEDTINDTVTSEGESDPANQEVEPEQDYNPDTVNIDNSELEDITASALAYFTSNKTVTQEEGQDDGFYNNKLDVDPYKQFTQGYLRYVEQSGLPQEGLHGKIIKDNDNLPHSTETNQTIAQGKPYGSVLVITDSDRNTLYFDENYVGSPDQREGARPIVFSFTSEYWDQLKNFRAKLGEKRTGENEESFLKKYDREKEQQQLARQLNDKDKDVNVEIKGVTPGVIRKSKNPMKSSLVVKEEMNPALYIPSSVDRYDPNNPEATKYVIVNNKALINGGLYAQTRDKKSNFISYTRLIPNIVSSVPGLVENISSLMSSVYGNKNEAELVRDYLKDILFLGKAKRPTITVTEDLDLSEYRVRLLQDNNLIDQDTADTFISQQRLNVSRASIENDSYTELKVENGSLKIEPKDNYKNYILDNSTTVDIPIQTEEGAKFIPINNYAYFNFLESPETMRSRLIKDETKPSETKLSTNPNETHVFRHGENIEDVTARNSGQNNVALDDTGKKYARDLGKILKDLGIESIITSPILRALETARIAKTTSGIKTIIENQLFKTWDIGDFTSKPDQQFDERWFIDHPDDTTKDGMKLGESFNQFLNRMIKAYEFVVKNTDSKTAIIAHSRDIKIWNAIKENNGFWNENARETYLNKTEGYDYVSIARQEVVGDNSSLTKQSLRRLGTAQSQNVEDIAKQQDQNEQDRLEGLKAIIDQRESRDLITQSEIDKVNQLFGYEVATRVNDIINSDARALWNTSGIKLYRDARQGDGYHEAWHHFSQVYLTKQEKRALYDEARKKNVDFKTRDGRELNSKTASDFDVEEFMADDFRDYVLSDGKSRLVNRPYRNNIFRKILDFLKKFFFGDINLSKLYDDLYKGNLNHYEPSINNAMWGKLNSRALDRNGNEIVNNQKAAYYRDLVDYLMGEQLLSGKTSIDAMRKNPKLSSAIYTNIYNDIINRFYNPIVDKQEAGQKTNEEVAQDLYNILSNWEGFVDYHKRASKLFLNINHEIVLDIPDNPEDITDQSKSLGEDNYEIKDQDEETLGADEVDQDMVQSDKLYDRSGNEQSSISAASIQTRGLIRMLPAIDYNNGQFTIQVDNNGFPRLNDYARTWNNIAYELSNLNTYDEMIQKLRQPSVMKKIPEVSILLQHLPDPSRELSPSEINTILSFRTDFNRAYIGIFSGKMYSNKNYYLNEETKRNADQVRKVWTANFFNKTLADPDVSGQRVLIDEETGKYYLNPGIVLSYNMKAVAGRDAFMSLIGMNFSDEAKADPFYVSNLPALLSEIQNNINTRHKFGSKIYNPLFDIRSELKDPKTLEILVKGLSGVVNGLVNYQAKYASDVPSLSYQTAEGEMIYGLSLNHTLSIVANNINKAKSYDDIKNNPAMQHLNKDNNPYVRGSIFLNTLFTATGKRIGGNSLIVGNYNGFKTVDNEGNTVGYSTTSLNVRQKAIFDINSLLSRGIVEIMRTESSKSAYFIKPAFYTPPNRFGSAVGPDPSTTYLPISFSELPSGFQSPRLMGYMIDYYLYDELYRMKNAENVDVYKTDPKLMQAAQGFNLFRDILRSSSKDPESLKNTLKSDLEKTDASKTINKNRALIEEAINNFFNREVTSFKEQLDEENITSADIAGNLPSKSYEQQLRTFIANDFLLNVEYTKLFNGDTIYQAQYKDYFKRSKGDISTGKTPTTDDAFIRHMHSIEGNTFGAFANSNISNDYKTFRTLNFKDDVRDSKYLDIYTRDLKAADPNLGEAEIQRWLDKYKGMKIADGQGYITLDFYRQFLKSISNWSDAQELGYQIELAKYRLANKDFNTEYSNEMKQRDREFLKQNPQTPSYYPPLKIQYNGPIRATGTFAPVMDKFSVVPIIPSIVQGTPLEQIHNEMIKNGIGYAKYLSGTKKYAHPAVDIYNEDGFTGLNLANHEPAIHYLDYLKEQINTNPKIKEESIFGSQIRKLIEANIFSSGTASEIDIDRHNRYKSYIKGIVDIGRKELYDEIGLKEEGGKIRIGDMEKFISTVQDQAELRELNDNIKDYIQYDKNTKKLRYALETSLNRKPIQDLLMGLVDRRLRVQKLSGDQLIQISSSGYQSNDFKYKNATEDEIKKYGTNGLRFYHLEYQDGKPSRIVGAQVKVALIGSFEKLLYKNHPDGKQIRTIERLNELLKDDNWVKENQKSITLVGYRIPTQGHNSMEHLQVAEFLPPHAGSVVIVPSEIVAKSGSDFDIDKLSIFRPSFNDKGELIDDKSKEGYSNKIINLFSEILSDPKIFKQLMRPNDTDLVKGETNNVAVAIGKRSASDAKEAKPYSGTQIYRYKSNLRKFETLLSAKRLLSIFAVNNTFTTVMQQSGTQQNMGYGLAGGVNRLVKLFLMSSAERGKVVKNGKLDLSERYSVDGNFKQDFYSQLINATVDAASDDFFGYVNMSYENVNVLCHLINQGVPFDRAIWFLNQPVLLRYYSDMRRREKGQSKDSIKALLLGQLTNKNFFNTTEAGRVVLDRGAYNKEINTILNNPKFENLFLSKEVLQEYTKKTRDVDNFLDDPKAKTYNSLVFSYFISLQEQAQLFRDLQRVSSYDTVKISSPTTAYSLFTTMQQIKANKLFDETEVGKISDKSIIGAFDNKRFVATIGAALMPVAFNPYFMQRSVPIIQKNTQYATKAAQKKFINNYETQWVEYVVKSLGKIGDYSLPIYGRYLQEGRSNIARRFNELINKYPDLKHDYAFVDKIRPNFPNDNKIKKSNIEVYRLFENTTDDQNRYIAEFRSLINLDSQKYNSDQTKEIQRFFKDLAILGFVQSGFSKSNISFQDIVPYEELADIFKAAVDNFTHNISSDVNLLNQYIKDFQSQFNLNQKSFNQPWRGRNYFLTEDVKKGLDKKMSTPEQKKSQVNTQTSPKPEENVVKEKITATTPQEELLKPEVKTERQYWPGYEIQDSYPNEYHKVLGKAIFKHAMDNLRNPNMDQQFGFADLPSNYVSEDVLDASVTNLTPENFEEALKVYKDVQSKIPDMAENVFYDRDNDVNTTLDEMEKALAIGYINDPNDEDHQMEYKNLEDLLESYRRGEISDEFIEPVEARLSQYGLLAYRDYNPNQIKLGFPNEIEGKFYTDEQYKEMLKNCKG